MVKRIRGISLTVKLTFSVLFISTIIYLVIFVFGYAIAKKIVLKNIREIGQNVVENTVKKFDKIEEAVARTTNLIEFILEETPNKDNDLYPMLKTILENNPDIFGASVSFEPYSIDPKAKYFSPYCYRTKNSMGCKMLGSESYDYFNLDWYKDAKLSEKPLWVGPYFDEDSGNIYILSHSSPIIDETSHGKVFNGVVSVDISLEWLQKTLSKVDSNHGGYSILISSNGTFLTFPKEEYVLKKTILDVAKEKSSPDLEKIANDMMAGKTGVSHLDDFITNEPAWIFYTPVVMSGWSIGVVFKEEILFSDVFTLARNMLLLGISGVAILFVILFILSKRITSPLKKLTDAAEEMSHGNLDAKILSLRRNDEVGILARSFKSMQQSLKTYIKELTAATAKKERIENELKIAHDIQQSIVPKNFDSITMQSGISAAGMLVPAQEVGGDLYDCFAINDKHLCFVIGDVADKGVHAALLMAIVQTLIRGLTKDLCHPDDILRIANKEVLDRSKDYMFITLFCGILNVESGKLRYANAGHVPPILLRNDSQPVFLNEGGGIPLGINPDATYLWNSIMLSKDDTLLMYTDGVTEATDKENKLFGEENLMRILTELTNTSPQNIVNNVFEAVKNHAGDRPPADDIALLSFSFEGQNGTKNNNILKITVSSDSKEIMLIAQKISLWGRKLGLASEVINEINLVIEELVINTISFGFDNNLDKPIEISIALEKNSLTIKIVDEGKPFNPLNSKKPDLTLPIDKRPIGGLGIFFVHELMDKVQYEHKDGRNCLTLTKKI